MCKIAATRDAPPWNFSNIKEDVFGPKHTQGQVDGDLLVVLARFTVESSDHLIWLSLRGGYAVIRYQ